ncbi:MAG: glycosyltransferase [Spirochaetaceae bacterium]|jgi:hypothetical protein|nr:glycosyltransferase [Spirochaetaceae bacterium]
MTRILISFYQPVIGDTAENIIHFYESVSNELEKAGNKVLLLNITPFQSGYYDGDITHKDYLIDRVREFKPELIWTYNNQIPECIIITTDCPIIVFDADSDYLFVHKEFIKKYQERYYMATQYPGIEQNYINLGFSNQRICSIHSATSVQKEYLQKAHNISFIGSKFQYYSMPDQKLPPRMVYKILRESWNDDSCDYYAVFCKYFNLYKTEDIYYRLFDSRNYILSSVLDLGLSLYGVGWDTATDNFALSTAFNPTPTYSLKHNQDLYNSSKICLSISHPQCKGYTYPWRIYDIMASSGLLIASYSKLLEEQTRGIVSIPMYHSPFDVRDLCKKYLSEPHLCEDIIAASNEFIEKHGRWKENFKTLESFIGIKLVNEHKGVLADEVIKNNIVTVLKLPDEVSRITPEELPQKEYTKQKTSFAKRILHKLKGHKKMLLILALFLLVFVEAVEVIILLLKL